MTKSYISSDGKVWLVKEMNDHHLVNAHLKLKRRIETLSKTGFQHKQAVLNDLNSQLKVLKEEINRRNLI